MSKPFALMSCVLLVAALEAGPAGAGAMTAPSTGQISGDWDVDPDVSNALSDQQAPLGGAFFHVEWTAAVDGRGEPRLSGYVYDDHGLAATHVQLQISAVDAAGHEIERVTRVVPGAVPAEGRAYFDVPVPAGQSYRVTVASFDLLEGVKG